MAEEGGPNGNIAQKSFSPVVYRKTHPKGVVYCPKSWIELVLLVLHLLVELQSTTKSPAAQAGALLVHACGSLPAE